MGSHQIFFNIHIAVIQLQNHPLAKSICTSDLPEECKPNKSLRSSGSSQLVVAHGMMKRLLATTPRTDDTNQW